MEIKRRIFTIIFSYLFIGILVPDVSYTALGQDQLKDLAFVDKNQNRVSFPFRFINNLIIVPVVINDSDTLHFILDTGLNTSIMTELSMGDSLSLNYTRQVKLSGLGLGDPIDAIHSYGNNFYISGIRGTNQDLYILLQNVFNLSSIFGTKVHGLIGYNIFKNFIVEINYEREFITFHNPSYYKPRKTKRRTKAVTLPLAIHRTKPYVFGTVVGPGNKVIEVKLLLDTGASHALWLDAGSDPDLEIPKETAEMFLGRGLNGDIFGKIGYLPQFTIGPFTFQLPIVAFPDSLSAGETRGMDDRNGSLGSEILRRFNVIIDYPNSQLTLYPNSQYKSQFKLNRSGIDVEAPMPEFPYYVISYIRKDSPGDKAGLKKGDEIKYINSKNTMSMSINDIYSLLQQKAGRKIKLQISREGYNFKVVLYLEDFI